MSSLNRPMIHLKPGMQIGYNQPLAAVEEVVTLENGTHFLLARNGRGKTTLLRTLARSLKALNGSFSVHGFVQYVPEDLRFDAEISARNIFRSLLGKAEFQRALALATEIELDVKKPYGQLSTGNRRKTSLIMAELSVKRHEQNVLLLDEPFSGLDAFARQAFEKIWVTSSANVLRLVSCHPDYDSMQMPSALLIESQKIRHLGNAGQTWSDLKSLMN